MEHRKENPLSAPAACTEPLCGGATEFYQRHARPDFIEACYSAAPPRIQQALAEELAMLTRALDPPGAVLEVGCGNGRVLDGLRERTRWMVGIDFLEPYVRQARRRVLPPQAQFTVARAGRLPFADGSFDYVLCVQNTLGVMGEDKNLALAEAGRVLRPGGKMIFVVYSELSVVARAEWYSQAQRQGLMAPIDWARSHAELLVTEDGHASECFRAERLRSLFTAQGLSPRLERLGDLYWVAVVAKDGVQHSV